MQGNKKVKIDENHQPELPKNVWV